MSDPFEDGHGGGGERSGGEMGCLLGRIHGFYMMEMER